MRILTMISALAFAIPVSALEIKQNLNEKADSGRTIEILSGNTNYRLTFTEETKDGKKYVRKIGLSGGTPGIRYSKRGWAGDEFLKVFSRRQLLSTFPATVNTTADGCIVAYAMPEGKISLVFTGADQSDKLFLTVKVEMDVPQLQLRFAAQPGNIWQRDKTKHERTAITAKQSVNTWSEFTLSKEEPWIYCYDAKWNPAQNGAFATNALLYDPKETQDVKVKVGADVVVTLVVPDNVKEAHYILWTFPGVDHQTALESMRKLEVK